MGWITLISSVCLKKLITLSIGRLVPAFFFRCIKENQLKMAKAQVATFFIVALLFCSTLTYAARPEPGFAAGSLAQTQQVVVEAQNGEAVVEESCEGVGEEECLMRRTLAAHIDYIYTQKQKP